MLLLCFVWWKKAMPLIRLNTSLQTLSITIGKKQFQKIETGFGYRKKEKML